MEKKDSLPSEGKNIQANPEAQIYFDFRHVPNLTWLIESYLDKTALGHGRKRALFMHLFSPLPGLV